MSIANILKWHSFRALCVGAICLPLTLAAESDSRAASSAISVHYTQFKSKYATGEPIVVQAECNNRGAKVHIYDQNEIWNLKVESNTGDEYPFKGATINVHRSDNFNSIDSPKDQYPELGDYGSGRLSTRCLNDYYGIGDGLMEFYLPPGEYRAWNTIYDSDTIAFSIENPVDSLGIAAMKILLEALDHRLDRLIGYEKTYQFYSKFYEDFSSTVYAERALRNLLLCRPEFTSSLSAVTYQAYVRQLILRFPNSWLIAQAMPLVRPEFVPASERDSLLRLFKNHLHTLPSDQQKEMVNEVIWKLER